MSDMGISDFLSIDHQRNKGNRGTGNLLGRTVKTKDIRILGERQVCHWSKQIQLVYLVL